MESWIKLYRKSLDNQVIIPAKFDTWSAWNFLLLSVQYSGDGRGTIKTSYSELARAWGWSRTGVKGYLERLKKAGMIDETPIETPNETPGKTVLIHIIKWNELQGKNEVKTPSETGSKTGSETPKGKSSILYKKECIKEGVKEARARTTPPTFEELQAFSYKEAQHVNLQRFWDFYQGKGWPEDWQAKMREWEAKDKADGKPAINIDPEEDEDLMWIRSHTKGLSDNEF